MPASNPRIDELRKKFDENPRRYFAPLANEYRKAGDLDQAIEICRTHLKEQPAHMSGHVVFGQALYEAKQFEEGRTVFEAALQLDPENLIALRHLGDIERETGNPGKARGWYQRVLDADPRNEEIQIQLAALPPAEPEVGAPPAEAPPEEEDNILGGMDWSDVAPSPAAPATPAPPPVSTEANTLVIAARKVPEPAAPPADAVELLDLRMSSGGMPAMQEPPAPAAASGGATEGFQSTHFDAGAAHEEASPLAGLSGNFEEPAGATLEVPSVHPPMTFDPGATAAIEPMELAIPEEPAARAEHRASVDNMMAWKTPTSVTPMSSTPIARGAVDPLLDDSFAEFTPPTGVPLTSGQRDESIKAEPPAPIFEPVDEPTPESAPALDDSMWATPEEPAATVEEPAAEAAEEPAGAFVTETMAELYVKQGLIEHAVGVYRQLVVQDPSDARLRSRLAQLEGSAAEPEPQPAPAYHETAATAYAPPEPVAPEPYVPRGPTMRELLARVASRRPGSGTWEAQSAPAEEVSPANEWPASATPAAVEATWSEPVAAPAPIQAQPSSPSPSPSPSPSASTSDGLSALFGGRGVRVEDEGAALALSGAFSNGDAPAAPISGRPTRAASDELSLDRVFADSPRQSSETRRSQGFSFDQFFSEGGAAPPAAPAAAAEPREADIAQFNSWLEGLKKK